jgi:hypothetical protein
MLATIDGGNNQSLRVEEPAVQLATIGQLEKTLADLHSCAVNLVQEQENRLLTGRYKPVRSVPSGSLAAIDRGLSNVRQAEKVTLSHLRSTALDNRKVASSGDLIDHLRFTNTMTATDKNGQLAVKDVRGDVEECCEVDSHDGLQCLRLLVLCLTL